MVASELKAPPASNDIMFTLEQLAQQFGGEIVGDSACCIRGLAPLESAQPQHLSFLANPKYLVQLEATQAGAVLITPADLLKVKPRGACSFLVTPNPYAYFARVAQCFVAAQQLLAASGIHPSAVIDPSARIAASASIGPHVVIEANAVLGARARLEAHVYIGHGVTIGDDAHLSAQVTVYHGCTLGARTRIHAGAVIGADGFGFAPDFQGDTGEWVKIPQTGAVVLGADVEIGANTTIDRGAMTDTVIEHGVKIDNLVQIAHNCRIGAYTVIAACAGIAGSTVIGRHCMIGGAVGIAGHLTLADRVIVTAKSGVSKSLSKPGVYTSAFPAIENAAWNRNAALMRNLDKMKARIKQLEALLLTSQNK